METTYELIRSARKTLAVEVREGKVLVRAPRLATRRRIEEFLEEKKDWIAGALERSRRQQETLKGLSPLTREEQEALRREAKKVFAERAAHYAAQMGVSYGSISVRFQRTRWGSCTARNDLNLNALLLLAPPEVLDSVVVHELCHIREKNHSKAFYALVRRYCPGYDRCTQWLKENGQALLGRLPKD